MSQKRYKKIDFKVDFLGIAIKVYARNAIVCIFEISKYDNFGQQFFFNPNKMFLVDVILLYQKQVKIDLGYPAQCRFNP